MDDEAEGRFEMIDRSRGCQAGNDMGSSYTYIIIAGGALSHDSMVHPVGRLHVLESSWANKFSLWFHLNGQHVGVCSRKGEEDFFLSSGRHGCRHART
jgi:hypothetical protein